MKVLSFPAGVFSGLFGLRVAVLAFALGVGLLAVSFPTPLAAQGNDAGGGTKTSKKKGPAEKPGQGEAEKAKKGGEEEPKPGGDDPDAVPEPPAAPPVEKPSKTKTEAGPISIDDQYVRDNLEGFLHATSVKWLEDGRVHLVFEFSDKDEEVGDVFLPKVAKDPQSKFRWTLPNEYGWGYSGTGTRSTSSSYWDGGLRMGMDGQAVLNCWFTDQVEAEIEFAQHVSYSDKQIFALVFTSASGKSVGCNYGTQAATFEKGRLAKKVGTVDQVLSERGMRFKLAVKDGGYEVFRDGKSKQKAEYAKKSFASGRVGFIWFGGVACIVHRLEIKGKIDAKKMAGILRKGK